MALAGWSSRAFGLVVEALASLIAPPRCAACDAPTFHAFCPACAASLVRRDDVPPRLAAFAYGGALATAIQRLKFTDRPDLARPLAACLARPVELLRGAVDLVVPVPLHPSRLVERGYNQAALLARPVARWLDAPYAPGVLVRTRQTARQTDLDAEARRRNLAAAFAVAQPTQVTGRRLLLVDDVETTGATLAAAAQALEAAGALRVLTLVVARTDGG